MALADLPDSGSANFETNCPAVLNSWKNSLEQKSDILHIHNGGSIYYLILFENNSIVINNGSIDGGELSVRQDNISNVYVFNSGTSLWIDAISGSASILQAEIFD